MNVVEELEEVKAEGSGGVGVRAEMAAIEDAREGEEEGGAKNPTEPCPRVLIGECEPDSRSDRREDDSRRAFGVKFSRVCLFNFQNMACAL